jgi:hypothetical protein
MRTPDPNQVMFIGRIRWAGFDCSQEPLPDKIRLLLWMIDGAERRHRVARRWLGEAQDPDLTACIRTRR